MAYLPFAHAATPDTTAYSISASSPSTSRSGARRYALPAHSPRRPSIWNFGVRRKVPPQRVRPSHTAPDQLVLGELALMLYAVVSGVAAWANGRYAMIPVLALFAVGYGLVASMSLFQGRGHHAVKASLSNHPI